MGSKEEIKNLEVLEKVKGMVSSADFERITEELAIGWTGDFELVGETNGEVQDCDEPYRHGFNVVNQTINFKVEGHRFAGEVYIPVSESRWFKFSYSMK